MTGDTGAAGVDPVPRSGTRRLTTAQAVIAFLGVQESERDGVRRPLIAGCFGIFGHGNVAGIGQALRDPACPLRYYQARNEQAMVHAAAGYARMTNRLSTLAATTSIGPGATNMITAAAGATINRLPVLLLPSDSFASRRPAPVLQELEHPTSADVSVNDCFRPVSRYFDRISRPEQLIQSLPAAMRVLTDPAETGTVVLSLPEDVQTFAYDFPEELFSPRRWRIGRPVPEPALLAEAARAIAGAQRPLIVAGGGVIYSEASGALRALVEATGIPVGETQAGKGSLRYDHPLCLGAIGATGTPAANGAARRADVVIGIGTRWSDFTTGSHTVFGHPDVRFVNINVAAFDGYKHAGIPVIGDAKVCLEALAGTLSGHRVEGDYQAECEAAAQAWDRDVERLYHGEPASPAPVAAAPDPAGSPSQAEVIGAVNAASHQADVVVCAAGSMPGDLHKLWRTRDPKGYHVEYGYSCMGYEIAGGLGVKMAAPDRQVWVMVGDGSWLMMSAEIVTSIQEHFKLVVVLVQNHGYASIGALSRSVGSEGFGTQYRYRTESGRLDGEELPVDLAANAASLGAQVIRVRDRAHLAEALADARSATATTVVYVETDRTVPVPGYGWWDVPVAEVAEGDANQTVRAARAAYERDARAVRPYL